jgi:predicted SAM-dependent methyltransferase
MGYGSETAKIRDKVLQYLGDCVIDIGYGGDPVTPNAFTVDGRPLPGLSHRTDNLYTLHEELYGQIPLADTVFSSHTLEHLSDHFGAIFSWSQLIKSGGYLVLYLPDGRYYNNRENPEHMVDTKYEDFMFWFERTWCGAGKDFRGNNFEATFRLIESGMDVGEDRYSFYLVAQKI